MSEKKRLELGMEVRDRVTGFQGIITARTTYLNACSRLTVSPPVAEKGTLPDSQFFDEPDLVLVGNGVYVPPEPKPVRTGGPHTATSRTKMPSRTR